MEIVERIWKIRNCLLYKRHRVNKIQWLNQLRKLQN